MNKFIFVLVVILFLSGLVLTGKVMAAEQKVIVGTAPGVPACQELNDLLPWQYQSYLYQQCQEYGVDYYFALAVIEMESQFNPNAFNKNTFDRGLMQVNKQWVSTFRRMGWISEARDLYDPKTNIQCGMYILADAVAHYGNTEKAYCYYNTGNPNVKSNKASRKVMKYWEQWKERFND